MLPQIELSLPGWRKALPLASLAILAIFATANQACAAGGFRVFVSDEKSGDITVINGADFSVAATINVGKRPRGIHASSDGKIVYVALSGTPMESPPRIDAHGNPVFERKGPGKDEEEPDTDKTADGIGIIDAASLTLTGKLKAGSDPEEFALSKDATQIYISNEDTKTASVIGIASAKVEHIVPVGQEPEGISVSPDGKRFYVTCEAGGDVYVIDTVKYAVLATLKVNGRPRSMDFLPGGTIGFVPSESAGELNVIDTANEKIVKTIALPAGSRPMRVRVSTDGAKLYLSNGRAGTVSVMDSHSYALLDTIKVGARPWGIDLSPDGRFLFSANGPSNDVSVVDLTSDKEIARIKAGSGPWGVAVVPCEAVGCRR